MNNHQLFEMSGRIFMLTAFVSIPCLSVVAFRACLSAIRTGRSSWRNRLGLASTVLTLTTWLAFAIFSLVVITNWKNGEQIGEFLLVLGVVAFFGSGNSNGLKSGLEGRPQGEGIFCGCSL